MNLPGNGVEMATSNNSVTEEVRAKLAAKPFSVGTVIFPKVGGALHTNKKRILVSDALLDNNLMGVTIEDDQVCIPDFLLRLFEVVNLSDLSNPGPLPSINATRVKGTMLPIPPLPEQRAIAAVLRIVQRAKEACEQVLAATRQLKQSLLHHLFAYGPVPLADAAHVRVKETEFGAWPNHWSISELGNLSWDISDGNYSIKYPRAEEFVAAGVPFIRANNMKGTRIVWDDMRFISPEKHEELAKGHLKLNDILITTRGDLGNVALVPDEFAGANINAQIVRMSTGEVSHPHFVLFAFQTPFVQNQIQGLKTGTALPQLPVGKLKMIRLPLAPRSEQREIARQLSAVDAKLVAEESRRSSLAALFHSLLHQLMTGKVRLPKFAQGHS